MIPLPEPGLGYQDLEEMMFGTVKTKLLLTAIELRVFDILDRELTVQEAARALSTHPGNTGLMLRALSACGLLAYQNGKYKNSPKAAAFLDSRSSADITQWLVDAARNFEPVLNRLAHLVKNGPDPLDDRTHMNSETMCDHFTHAHAQTELAGVARRTAEIVKALPEFQGFGRMMDLGGGPGINAVALVQSHPRMTAVVFDREPVTAAARKYIEAYGVSDRVTTRSGDYLAQDPDSPRDLGGPYDLILASDTLYYGPEDLDRILARLFAILNPGGVLVGIHGVLTCDRTRPAHLVLGMLPDALMDRGELPDSGFLAPSLLRAGFVRVHTRNVMMVSNEMEVDIARKPG